MGRIVEQLEVQVLVVFCPVIQNFDGIASDDLDLRSEAEPL
jgi:hypothetical protein